MRVRICLQVRHTAERVYSTSDKSRGGFSWNTFASPTFLISETTAPATDEGVRLRFNSTPYAHEKKTKHHRWRTADRGGWRLSVLRIRFRWRRRRKSRWRFGDEAGGSTGFRWFWHEAQRAVCWPRLDNKRTIRWLWNKDQHSVGRFWIERGMTFAIEACPHFLKQLERDSDFAQALPGEWPIPIARRDGIYAASALDSRGGSGGAI